MSLGTQKLNLLTNEAVNDLQEGRVEDGVQKLRDVLAVDPKHSLALLNLGMALMDTNLEEARGCFVQALKLAPSMHQALHGLAMVESTLKRYKQSVFFFKRAIQALPSDPDLHYNLANDLLELSSTNEAEAIKHYREAIQLDPSHTDAGMNLAIALSKAGDLSEAIAIAKKTLSKSPSNLSVRTTLAELCKLGGEPQNAIVVLEPVVKRLKEMNLMWRKQQKEDSSREVMWKGESADTVSNLMAVYGSAHQTLHNITEAVEAFTLATLASYNGSGNPNQKLAIEYRFRLLSLYIESSNWEAACNVVKESQIALSGLLSSDTRGKEFLQSLLFTHEGALEKRSSLAHSDELSHTLEQAILHCRLPNSFSVTSKCILAEANRESQYIPKSEVVSTRAELEAVLETSKGCGKSWFLKDPNVQRGQGIQIITVRDNRLDPKVSDLHFTEGNEYVLQEAVEPALIDGTKFGVRVHVFAVFGSNHSWSLYLFPEGILTKCAVPYSGSSRDPLAQITCTSVQRTLEDFDRSKVKGPASVLWEEYSKSVPELKVALLEVFRGCHKVSPLADFENEEQVPAVVPFQVFGCDILFCATDGKPVVLECNSSPQFQDAKALESLESSLARPMINGLLDLLVNITRGESMTSETESSENLSTWQFIGTL